MAKNKNKQRREKNKKKRKQENKMHSNWLQDNFNNTTGTNKAKQPSCHTGCSAVYYNENGRALWIGGWKNAASYTKETFVIDLTGDEHKFADTPMAFGKDAEELMNVVENNHAGWLSLPFPDYRTPKNMTTYETWFNMAMGIKKLLDSDKEVLVACLGGHGRSGLFCAIVGYILHNGEGWDSPVDKIRGIHCSMAVETDAQEQFVYDILGLDLVAKPEDYNWFTDYKFTPSTNYKKCPKCKTESIYIKTLGHCLSCSAKTKTTKPIMDITEDLLKTVDCTCENANCLGSWVAEKCGHSVHDMIVQDGYCETCIIEQQEAEEALEKQEKSITQPMNKCELCNAETSNGFWRGICFMCTDDFGDDVPAIHDTLLDNVAFVNHQCTDAVCKGIVKADVCGHVVHNRYVVDGQCPECYNVKMQKKLQEKIQ